MTQITAIDPQRAAVLMLDFTEGIVDNYATRGRAAASQAAILANAARSVKIPILFVIPGSIESDGNSTMKLGAPISSLSPEGSDRLFFKSGIGAFTSEGLSTYLRRERRDTLIICGIATSGTVLSTTRTATDLGFKVHVIEDACSDPEEQVHELLTQRVHPKSWVGLWRVAEILTTVQVLERLPKHEPPRFRGGPLV